MIATALAAILVVLVLLVVAAFLMRGMIARQALEAWLREAGVEADISIAEVGVRGARAKIDLGDVAARDLSIGDVELDYDLVAPWFGRPAGVKVRAVRLRDVVVRARLRDGRLSLGRLDKLIEQLSAQPKGEPAPLPDIDLQRGAILLTTDAGVLRLNGSGVVKDGALQRFDGALLPTTLRQEGLAAEVTGGRVTVRRVGGGYDAQARVTAARTRFAGIDGGLLAVDLSAVGPVSVEKGFTGRVRLDATSADLKAGDQRLSGARIVLDAPSLSVVPVSGGVRSSGAATIRLSSARATLGEAAATGALAEVTLDRHLGVWTKGRNSLDAAFLLDATAASLATPDVRLEGARVETVGSIAGDPANPSVSGHGLMNARGRLADATARRLAATLPLVAQEPRYRQAFLSAARDFRLEAPAVSLTWRAGAGRVGLARPASVRAGSGARLIVAPRGGAAVYASQGSGALDATLAGGGMPELSAQVADWRWRDDVLEARGQVRGAFDLSPLDDVTADAAGRLRLAGDAVSFTADRCVTLSVRHIELDANDLTNVKGQACPTGAPLFTAQGGGWRARAAFRAAEFVAPAAEARVRNASGTVDLREQAGVVRLAVADVVDTAAIPRFSPLRFSGAATQRGQVWTAQAAAALPDGVRLATAQGRHDLTRGVGEATFDTGLLSFAEDGFQPERVTPMAHIAGRVVGRAQFQGRADWSPAATHSSGRLTLDGLDFDSPAGRIAGAVGEIVFTSLAPLTTPPDQRVRAAKLAFFTPLTDIDATFALDAEQLRLAQLTAKAAGGVLTLEPMSVRLADGSTRGALVLDDVDLNQIVAATNLAEKIRLNAVVDGRLPFSVGPEGVRVENGRLASVKSGRLYIARDMLGGVSTSSSPGAPTPTTVNAIQDFAYQAMENLTFETLIAEVASRDDGRLGLVFQIKGRHDPEVAERARLTILDVLRGRAFERRIPLPKGTPIDLTLDSSVNFDELVKAYAEAWRQKVEETP